MHDISYPLNDNEIQNSDVSIQGPKEFV
jgi:hypothetical protein